MMIIKTYKLFFNLYPVRILIADRFRNWETHWHTHTHKHTHVRWVYAKCDKKGEQRKQRNGDKTVWGEREKGEAECDKVSEGEPRLWALLLDGCRPWSLSSPNGTFGTCLLRVLKATVRFTFVPTAVLSAQLTSPLCRVRKLSLSNSDSQCVF